MTEFVKRVDYTGVPVTLSLRGEGDHKTFVGGCCSLIVILLTLLIITSEWSTVFFNTKFNMQEEVNYLQEATERDRKGAFNVASEEFIPAMLYWNRNTKVDDINSYLKANYFYVER